MFAQPKLTICVPSRNRQRYFQETIRSQLMNLRTDVEFVFADNSDDPSIMNDFMADVVGDPRVKYLQTDDRIHPMTGNWERTVAAATGEFICVIGDDDYVDANVVDLITTVQKKTQIDCFVWSRLNFNWPLNRPMPSNLCVPMGTDVHKVKRHDLFQQFFTWSQFSRSTPNCPFAIYHSAVSREIMNKIKAKFGGRYFEHPTVDFENSCKLLTTAEHFVYCERPFSILGACPDSNSASIWTLKKSRPKHAEFQKELGRNMDEDPYMKDFPFPSSLGLAACIAQCQHWFKTKYGYVVDGWERNFAAAAAQNCGMMGDRETYDAIVEGYTDAFTRWRGGKYIADFKPKYTRSGDTEPFAGLFDGHLYVPEVIGDAQTPAECYHLIEQMITRPADLNVELMKSEPRRTTRLSDAGANR